MKKFKATIKAEYNVEDTDYSDAELKKLITDNIQLTLNEEVGLDKIEVTFDAT